MQAAQSILYKNRRQAGVLLAERLTSYKSLSKAVVLGLPRGGVPVAFEVAKTLNLPLDIFMVRKLGLPGQEELALGAIARGGVRVLNESLIEVLGVTSEVVDEIAAVETKELQRREQLYLGEGAKLPDLDGRIAILVDDGLATGATMLAAIKAVRLLKPDKIVVAVPVASASTCLQLKRECDEFICAAVPSPFQSVGQHYEDFSQVSDDAVREFLDLAKK